MKTVWQTMQMKRANAGAVSALRDCTFDPLGSGTGRQDML